MEDMEEQLPLLNDFVVGEKVENRKAIALCLERAKASYLGWVESATNINIMSEARASWHSGTRSVTTPNKAI